jgi:alpha-tubulin suppressor-like RCC1 family protein
MEYTHIVAKTLEDKKQIINYLNQCKHDLFGNVPTHCSCDYSRVIHAVLSEEQKSYILNNHLGLINDGKIYEISEIELFNNPGNFENIYANIELQYYGKNVDIVIIDDSAPSMLHPDFFVNDNNSGMSRMQNIDWNLTPKYKDSRLRPWSGIPDMLFPVPDPVSPSLSLRQRLRALLGPSVLINGTQASSFEVPAFYMRYPYNRPSGDSDTHGVHVAGTAGGNTQGWAKKSNIYFLNFRYRFDFISVDDETFNDPIALWYEHILNFHSNKPINPHTNKKNPTIANMSFGLNFLTTFLRFTKDISKVFYRGQMYLKPPEGWKVNYDFNVSVRGQVENFGILTGRVNNELHTIIPMGSSVSESDPRRTYIEDMINNGIIVVAAAGNAGYKVDIPGGIDYDNYFELEHFPDFPIYYHRGSWPANLPGVISVGSMDTASPERKSFFSNCGPGVTIYAPGSYIASTYDGQGSGFYSTEDERDSSYYHYISLGTSMASPQIAGMLACYAEKEPNLTPEQAKDWLLENGKAVLNDSNGGYTDVHSLQGGTNKVAYFPYGTFTIHDTPTTTTLPPLTSILTSVNDTFVDVSAKYYHALALTSNQEIYTWGWNHQGQLGNGTVISSPIPQKIMGSGYIKISAGFDHSLAIKNNGDLYHFGSNLIVGNPAQADILDGQTTLNNMFPVKIGEGFIDISASQYFSLALKSNGDLYFFGFQFSLSLPGFFEVPESYGATSLTKIGEGFVKIASGPRLGIAIKENGDLFHWGIVNFSDDQGTSLSSTPIKKNDATFSCSSASAFAHVLAIDNNNQLYTWGFNSFGQLGHSGPQIRTNRFVPPLSLYDNTPTLIGNDYVSVSAGASFSLGLKNNGELYAWGSNINFTLGDGSITTFNNLDYNGKQGWDGGIDSNVPKLIGSGYSHMSGGANFCVAIKNGDLYTWGTNVIGQLGNGLLRGYFKEPTQITIRSTSGE